MIQEISSYADLCAIEREWSDLWKSAPDATPFQSPEWLLPWWRHLFGGGEMWTIAIRQHNRLIGFAPMFIHGSPGEPRQVSFIGTGVSDYLGFLARDREAARQIWFAIAGARPQWDFCDFQEIRDDSPMLDSACDALMAQRRRSNVCPVLQLPRAMQELEANLSRKFRHNVRNSRNRLRDMGVALETAQPSQDQEYVDALFRLHAARWQQRGEPGVLASARTQEFFREASAGFRRRDWLRLHGLRHCGELKAVVCIFCTPGRSAFYLGGFDPNLSRYSPGAALIAFAIEEAIAEGSAEFDFLRHSENYKYAWGAADRLNARLIVRRPQ